MRDGLIILSPVTAGGTGDADGTDDVLSAGAYGDYSRPLRLHASLSIGSAITDDVGIAGWEKSTREVILIIRFPSRPSRLNAISTPRVLRNA
jgi:hypothetical protein